MRGICQSHYIEANPLNHSTNQPSYCDPYSSQIRIKALDAVISQSRYNEICFVHLLIAV